MIFDWEWSLCIHCGMLKTNRDMEQVFRTGFAYRSGVHYPLGMCKLCDGLHIQR